MAIFKNLEKYTKVMKVNMVNNMCDRTIKMKLKKGSILNEVNSNTNSIEFNVKPLYTSNDKTQISDIIDRINEDIKNITKNVDK